MLIFCQSKAIQTVPLPMARTCDSRAVTSILLEIDYQEIANMSNKVCTEHANEPIHKAAHHSSIRILLPEAFLQSVRK